MLAINVIILSYTPLYTGYKKNIRISYLSTVKNVIFQMNLSQRLISSTINNVGRNETKLWN